MKIVIVGGGTAGWITTFMFKKFKPEHEYVNISSSELDIIGVGESTTYKFIDIFTRYDFGIPLIELYRECFSLPKLGIRFENWGKIKSSFDSPIEGSVTSNNEIDYFLYNALLQNHPVEKASVGGNLSINNKTNFYINEDPYVVSDILSSHDAAMHIDTFKTSSFFKKKSIECGVRHLNSKIIEVSSDGKNIKEVTLDTGEKITADLYIDCSGFNRILCNKLDEIEWKSFKKYLPVNTAIPFILENDDYTKYPVTTARAMNSGWIWEIPTHTRIGRGYVFDSNFITVDEAVDEIEQFYSRNVTVEKIIKFDSGRLQKSLVGNCVAFGLSSSFLEPLESTSIHCTVTQIEEFILNCMQGDQIVNRDKYNNFVSNMVDDMRDFVSLHYTGGREDTPFWRYVKTLPRPKKVKEIIDLCRERLLRRSDFAIYNGSAGQPLWIYILSGLGYFDDQTIIREFQKQKINLDQLNTQYEEFTNSMNFFIDKCISVDKLDDYLHPQ
jgi:tryptophan halogenase